MLGTAIGEIMEDTVSVALKTASTDEGARVEQLTAAGQDIEVLARAMSVLLRRKGKVSPAQDR